MTYLRLALLCALGLAVLTALIAAGVAIPGDFELVRLAVSVRQPMVTAVVELLTFVSSSVPALVVTLAVTGFELRRARRLAPRAAWATGAYLGSTGCNIALRLLMGRLRPAVDYKPLTFGSPEGV